MLEHTEGIKKLNLQSLSFLKKVRFPFTINFSSKSIFEFEDFEWIS